MCSQLLHLLHCTILPYIVAFVLIPFLTTVLVQRGSMEEKPSLSVTDWILVVNFVCFSIFACVFSVYTGVFPLFRYFVLSYMPTEEPCETVVIKATKQNKLVAVGEGDSAMQTFYTCKIHYRVSRCSGACSFLLEVIDDSSRRAATIHAFATSDLPAYKIIVLSCDPRYFRVVGQPDSIFRIVCRIMGLILSCVLIVIGVLITAGMIVSVVAYTGSSNAFSALMSGLLSPAWTLSLTMVLWVTGKDAAKPCDDKMEFAVEGPEEGNFLESHVGSTESEC